jgi:hypothetical protein
LETIQVIYILNATLLLLHEIESAFEREWEILKLPGHITGFLLMHIPIILALFYGLLELEKGSRMGLTIAILCGVGGVVPYLVHKLFVRRDGRFERTISNAIIYLNGFLGIALVVSAGCRLT